MNSFLNYIPSVYFISLLNTFLKHPVKPIYNQYLHNKKETIFFE